MIAAQELAGTFAEESLHRMIEMRLVVKSSLLRNLCKLCLALGIEEIDDPVDLHDLTEEFGTDADDPPEPPVQRPAVDVKRLAKVGYAHRAIACLQPPHGCFDDRIRRECPLGEAPEKLIGLGDVLGWGDAVVGDEAFPGQLKELRRGLIERCRQAENLRPGDAEQPMMSRCGQLGDDHAKRFRVAEADFMIGDLTEQEPARDALEGSAVDAPAFVAGCSEKAGEIGIAGGLSVECYTRIERSIGVQITPDERPELFRRKDGFELYSLHRVSDSYKTRDCSAVTSNLIGAFPLWCAAGFAETAAA